MRPTPLTKPLAPRRVRPPTPAKELLCAYYHPWLDHFAPPIGTGRGCVDCGVAPFTPKENDGGGSDA